MPPDDHLGTSSPLCRQQLTPDVAVASKPSPRPSPTIPPVKRVLSDESIAHTGGAELKRAKYDGENNEQLRGRGGSTTFSSSPGLPRPGSVSPPDVTFLEVATTMLSRAEDTGGNRTVRLVRGTPDSPLPSRASPRPSSNHGHELQAHPYRTVDSRTKGAHLFGSIGLAEFLQHDERPIFAIDLIDEASNYDGLSLIFTNTALRLRPALLDCVEGKSEDAALLLDLGTPFVDFKSWVLNPTSASHDVTPSFPFAGVLWRFSTVRKRLRVVTAHADDANHGTRRPGLSVFKGLGGSTSTVRASRTDSDNSGYFDIRPMQHRKNETPSNMENLVMSSFPSDSPTSQLDYSSGTASHGDAGISELLNGPLSAGSEPQQQRNYIMSSNPEKLQGMSTSYFAEKGFFDWTRLPMSNSLPEHIQFARGVDWADTSLGPIEEWSADLRGMCNLIMASPHPAAMYWGQDHVAIYNEAYIMLAGQKHPTLMGSRYADAWAEIWEALEEVFDVAMSSAQATMKDDDCLFIKRNGFLEETYFSWSIIPLIGDDGSVVGLYNPAFEKTRRKIAERRMLTLREIGERTAAARAVSQFWSLLVEGFQYNEYDAPLVIIYSLTDAEDSDASSSASSTTAASKVCHLEGTLGVEPGHPAAPPVVDLKHDQDGFAPVFRKAITADKPIILSTEDGTLDQNLLDGIAWRGFGDPSRLVVVSPVRPTTGESTLGFLVMGTNPRRPYDEDYDLFVQLLGRQLATSVASVVLFEEEIRKGERAAQMAAQDRIELSNQLAARTQEAVESENKFTRMAELAPVGMYIGDAEGKLTFANDAWHTISSFPREQRIGNDWFKYVVEEDQPLARDAWSNMVKTICPLSIEFRFKTPWGDKLGNHSDTWVIASASPEKDEDGKITRIFGSITDISSQKFAETLQKRRVDEAVEMKRQQERYIDTTSHEMRNPLSAILQSADSITSSLSELRQVDGFTPSQIDVLDTTIDSAQTITLCAQHQKRIVDDVLTLSKLDSAMLLVTPVDSQPVLVVQRALKMFESELQTADIALDVRIDKSYQHLEVDWVRLDPTRLSQVLINLTTNAIKFTTTQEKRTIRMHVAASKEKPSQEDKWKLTYIPTQNPKDLDVTAAPEWGMGETVYIHFAVQDTGRGLTEAERKLLFQRFSQANPRTHVTYGGSGLGLFISRMLVELQGGEIGVASEAGKGSTFAFYVKARHSKAPPSGSEDDTESFQSRKSSKTSTKLASKLKSQVAHAIVSSGSPLQNQISATPATVLQSAEDTTEPSLKVLVVEDNLINQKVLASQLRRLGCTVHVANHGGEAIETIKQSTFYHKPTPPPSFAHPIEISVVLMDLEMPVMDGQTCARKLREMQRTGELIRHIPVIAVTANAREEQIRNTLEAGMDDVVSKPFRITELMPKIRDVIARLNAQAIEAAELKTPVRNGDTVRS